MKRMGPLMGWGGWGDSQPLCLTVNKPRNTQKADGRWIRWNNRIGFSPSLCPSIPPSLPPSPSFPLPSLSQFRLQCSYHVFCGTAITAGGTLLSALQTRSLQYALFGVPLEDLPEASDNAECSCWRSLA